MNTKLPIPVVTYFFLFAILIFQDLATIAVPMNNIIINPIDVQRFSSTSAMSSKANVAMTPPMFATAILNQNKRSVSFFVADLSTGSSVGSGFSSVFSTDGASSVGSGVDSDVSVGGNSSVDSGRSLFSSLGGGFSAENFFFLNLAI